MHGHGLVEVQNQDAGRARETTAPPLRMVFWETTKGCDLTCRHCRAVPERERSAVELTTVESRGLIDQIADIARPVMIFSGGEPLYRPDIFELGACRTPATCTRAATCP